MFYEQVNLYEDRDDVTLTSYVLDDSVEMLNGGKKGAVLICPGGAFLYCSDREGEPAAMAFAAMGYHTFVLRYSVYNENKGINTMDHIMPDPNKEWEEKPNGYFPGPIRDVGKAMLYIREHADQWHIDMDKVAVCGFSAGAYASAMYSVYYNQPIITEFLGIEAEGIRPAAAILGYTLSDYVALMGTDPKENPLFAACTHAYTGKETITDLEYAKKLSPCYLVNETTPPMFLWTTAKDQVVDPEHTLRMALALNKYKIPYELHIFEEGQHGMVLGTNATAGCMEHLDTNIENWIYMTDKWMQKRMAPEIPTGYQGF